MFVRACRTATIRTRLTTEAILERVASLVKEPPPEGFDRLSSDGFWLNGWVGPKVFDIDYRSNSRHPYLYAVHGRVQETMEWRIVRLKMTARAPWLTGIEIVLFVGLALASWATGAMEPGHALALLLLTVAFWACRNLLVIPAIVQRRISSRLATQVDGSVEVGGRWVVPR